MHTTQPTRKLSRSGLRIAIAAVAFVTLSACGARYTNHGYIPPQDELDQIAIGVDTRASVEETLGTAASSSVVGDSGLYYVRSRKRSFAMIEPQVVEREVVAISFDNAGVVSNVERFGLERGQVVPLARRVTDSGVNNQTFLRQLLGNIGKLGPSVGG